MALEGFRSNDRQVGALVTLANGQKAYLASSREFVDPRQLADEQTLAAGATTTPEEGIVRGEYLLTVLPVNTAIHLEALGPDGTTWIDVGAISGRELVYVGEGATLRLKNTGGSAINGVSASLT